MKAVVRRNPWGRDMNYLCITVDGLHNGMIGAYGNGWIQTPSLDLLASESVVFDRYYTDSMDVTSIFDSLWDPLREPGAVLPTFFRDKGYRTVLLTDDTDVFAHRFANAFTEVHRLEIPNENEPSESSELTQFVEAFATAVDVFVANISSPCFLWLHLQGFRGPWDFPMENRRETQAEDDPEPYDEIVPPNIDFRDEIDPDVLQSIMEAYAGGMSVLDHALGGLLDSLQEGELGDNTLLMFGSTRGFSLGEHRRIGADERLYGENVHLPLMFRFPDGFAATVRSPVLLQPSDVGKFFVEPRPFLDLLQNETEMLHETLSIVGENGETALVTPEWFLRKYFVTTNDVGTFRKELYLKPDDRWEVNDVADRCQDIVEQLTAHE